MKKELFSCSVTLKAKPTLQSYSHRDRSGQVAIRATSLVLSEGSARGLRYQTKAPLKKHSSMNRLILVHAKIEALSREPGGGT